MEVLKSIFELIDSEHFRKRPAMYLGEKSISRLKLFMAGYETCEQFNQIKTTIKPPFWLFFPWIARRFEHSGSYYSWDGIILLNCDNDEAKALDVFFELFDKFRKITPHRILSSQIDSDALAFFQSSEGIRWQGYNLDEMVRVGPADQIFIVEYKEDLGCTIHHQAAGKVFHADSFVSPQRAIEEAQREYGLSLIWQAVPETQFASTYEMIN